MDFKEIRELVEMINSSELAYFELKMGESYIKMDKSLTRNTPEKSSDKDKLNTVEDVKNTEKQVALEKEVKNEVSVIDNEVKEEDLDLIEIKCPMVGTFYSSSAPGKDAFVKEGDKVSKGNVLCIVEAMKLMNEIECEYDCEIYKVLVNDGDMVEYGQPLFSVRRV
ncbi:acetyl-CoA carboxylase biotin carboxyl carrier protein [Clostridium chauvoei]|uniref:Biotin carboxyl carrier protein of acetyl-CoA carboxylase n=2 Tax=Clostridium chauvoei TaxID=46867 RepID=S6F8Z4_9CLOT|nr:acetyl-CoA carboxylase biotin carboxyl carrier protein [Clostridium chauvoei]ATD54862.1 acetyl-CoA carboxylase, biotin carboxyl carrier protein [Clostridium chauvoei]ATD57459.1 acetyl-CoA carboxylase, biotin carboxyl carrier protein [Clostridium chauvoei]MBX7280526.1 acetyl-CoA carboxylase biotin carboxyl carrier protein [Clostridium chauvoei]MBX7283011.1 acetyl-CoA carboxylase biotin carboxyl carrier protein [Clostridium chauvoei]MBX7285528.1 acetyl-CoA carboxylase biotin carboxyl carrier 